MGTSSLIEQFTANELNQYESRTMPGKVLVTGEAATNATVNVRVDENSTARLANRHDGYFWQVLTADNASALVATTNLQVRAFMSVVQGTNANSLVRAETREGIVPQTPEPFSYDADGNLLSDGLWTYAWDAENRLTNVESIVDVPDAIKKRLTLAYDHQGRRVRKTIESGYSGGVYATTNVTTFIWNDWLPIAELGAGYTNFMTWGIDFSGTPQGAGGVGGLVAMNLNGANCFPVYDGNGNVMALVTTSGTVVADYEYDPFGEVIKATGPQSTNNHFRFSTKYTDPETGLAYYGFRYYSPGLGRWLNRDTIAERGGLNLYSFVRNAPYNVVDALGLDLYLINKPQSAMKQGHSGAIVGGANDGFTYHSFALKSGFISGPAEYDDAGGKRWPALKGAVLYAKEQGYVVWARFVADAQQDQKAREVAVQWKEKGYALFMKNCVLMVDDMMTAAGIDHLPGVTHPNKFFLKNAYYADEYYPDSKGTIDALLQK